MSDDPNRWMKSLLYGACTGTLFMFTITCGIALKYIERITVAIELLARTQP